MLSPAAIFWSCCLYVAFIFVLALGAERRCAAGEAAARSGVIYALSLTAYLTAWTFYGNVGKATSSGMLFLTIYLGPTLVAVLWWMLLRKMVRIKNLYKITSIADFISLRYGKSAAIAALVTVVCLFALVPYYALQIRATQGAFLVITGTGASPAAPDVAMIFSAVIILLTIIFGVRRLAPTARHPGMVVAMSVAGVVKLASFLAVAMLITYGVFGGIGDLFARFSRTPAAASIHAVQSSPSFYSTWLAYLILSGSAVIFLPHQFHLAVVENVRQSHIRTAMWLFPLYMFLLNLFVMPVAIGGLLSGIPQQQADIYTIMLPLAYGYKFLPLATFVGGFAAATGMIMISSMTVSTMVTNHLLLPVIEALPPAAFMKRYLLQCRWAAVALLVLASYAFQRLVGSYVLLSDIGVTAFAAIVQFVPAVVGGLFWKRGSSTGALLGMSSGFALWLYTLIMPIFAGLGLLPRSLLDSGPFGIDWLRPQHLFGMSGFDPIAHAVFYTLLFNTAFYLLGSLWSSQDQREVNIAEQFVDAFAGGPIPRPLPGEATIAVEGKRRALQELFAQYFPADAASRMVEESLAKVRTGGAELISIAELAELCAEAEIRLASAIGAAAAHSAFVKAEIISHVQERALKQLYADLIAELKLAPSDLKKRIDFHREREKLLTMQAEELEEKVRDRDREIAERKKAEEAMRGSERRFADIIDFLPDPTFVIDAEGKIIIWNRAAEEFTGVKAEEMLGKGNHEYSVPFFGWRRPLLVDLVLNPTEEVKALYPNVIRNGRVVIDESETRSTIRGNGYVVLMAAALLDAEGRVTGVIESVRDITERRQAEEELKKHRDKLEEMVRERTAELVVAKERAEVASQAKTAFLSSMSHELRTPLNAILGYAQILKRQENLTDSQRQQLDIVRASGEHLLVLINDILDMSKIEAQKMELEEVDFDLCVLLQQVFDIARIKAEEKSLLFQYQELTPMPKFVRGDQRKLKQVLLNLLSNAIKYTKVGQVLMRVSYDRSETFRCEIADTGVGIAPDKQETVFEPFTQLVGAGQVREGTGLGLSITKRLVTMMQGKVSLESEPGRGSTFAVELPLPAVSRSEVCTESAAQGITGYRGVRKRILVADDNITNTSMLVSLLEPLGFEVVTASNGREAVHEALQRRPDLIVIDLVMPEMDGLEAVKELRQHRELDGTSIIGTSAMLSGGSNKASFAAACDVFLVKPLAIEVLLEKIREFLGLVWEIPTVAAPQAGALPGAGEAVAETLAAPPPEELKELYELAVMGNMQRIQKWAAELAEREPRYAAFAAQLQELAAKFRAKAVVALVDRYMRERL